MGKNIAAIWEKNMTYLYHSTFGAYLNDIAIEGLIPNKHKTWGECDYGIYLANDKELARSYTETVDNPDIPDEWFDDIIVLKIDRNLLKNDRLVSDPHTIWHENANNYQTYLYKGSIPLEAIVNLCFGLFADC